MGSMLFVSTREGMVVFTRQEDGWREFARGLTGRHVTCVAVGGGVVLAGTTDGVFRSDDQGQSWREEESGLEVRHVRWLARHPDIPGVAFAGTQPADIFFSRDDGRTWAECHQVAELRDRYRWSMPYAPDAGCVRGLAFHGKRGYAAVEVGGVLVSEDGGETWQLAEGSSGQPSHVPPPSPFVNSDVHSVLVHPSSADLVFAVTADGLYRSADGGKNWINLSPGSYCRAAWVAQADADRIILGPAKGVDVGGRIEQSVDGGKSWQPASRGLLVPWPSYMVDRFIQHGDELFAVLSNGRLLVARLDELVWRPILAEVAGITMVAVL